MPIAIVIPAYNASGFLAYTIESVVHQSVDDWMLTVVDDGSTDSTAEVARGYAERNTRIRVVAQANGGVARARNAGLRAALSDDASVEFLMLLDHDDVLHPNALSTLSAALNKHPDAAGAHGLARKVGANGEPIGNGAAGIQNFERRKLVDGHTVNAGRLEPTTAAMVVYDNLIPTPGVVLLRRSTIDAVAEVDGQAFDPAAAPLDDWDFWLRVTRIGDLAFVDETVLDWRRHEAAGSQNIAAMSAAEMRIRKRLIAEKLPADLAEVAEYRYRKLLATTRRRAARERWSAAGRHFRGGRIGAGLVEWSGGLSEYLGYLRAR